MSPEIAEVILQHAEIFQLASESQYEVILPLGQENCAYEIVGPNGMAASHKVGKQSLNNVINVAWLQLPKSCHQRLTMKILLQRMKKTLATMQITPKNHHKTSQPLEINQMLSLERYKIQASATPTVERCGRVIAVRGLMVMASGPAEAVGQCCRIETRDGPQEALVVGFDSQGIMLQPLGKSLGIAPGDQVLALRHGLQITVGPELLGRVLDGLGQPIDDLGPLRGQAKRPADADPPKSVVAPAD